MSIGFGGMLAFGIGWSTGAYVTRRGFWGYIKLVIAGP